MKCHWQERSEPGRSQTRRAKESIAVGGREVQQAERSQSTHAWWIWESRTPPRQGAVVTSRATRTNHRFAQCYFQTLVPRTDPVELNSPFPCDSEADAASLAAAGTAETAPRSAPAPFRPFHPESPICTSLTCQWATLHNAAPGHWSGPAREFGGTHVVPILADA
jgi:hypothetical protein